MSLEKLLATLQVKAEDEIRKHRQDAEAKAKELEQQTSEAIRRLRAEHERRLIEAVAEEGTAITAAARQKGKALRLKAEERIASRLYEIGKSLLSELRRDNYQRTFECLVEELPKVEWRVVTVNPRDVEAAGSLFRQAKIVADGRVSGGLRVESEDGLIAVDNTFEKRLQMAWPRLLPRLIKELHSQAQ